MKSPRRFTADPAKNVRNVAERGIDLVKGAAAFGFDFAIVAVDDRKDYGEVREVATGFIGGRLHVLVFTMRGDACHVISLRKANDREIRDYARKSEELE
jgi:uncharacterized DUF497 family protein